MVPAPPGGGLDRVFQITPAASGTLSVSVGYQTDGVTPACNQATEVGPDCWLPVLYARTTCDDAATEIASSCTLGINMTLVTAIPATTSFAVTAHTPYWVFVDGFDDGDYSYGPFNLIVTLE
jgi:hypothetical protein